MTTELYSSIEYRSVILTPASVHATRVYRLKSFLPSKHKVQRLSCRFFFQTLGSRRDETPAIAIAIAVAVTVTVTGTGTGTGTTVIIIMVEVG
jgi:hypothetical protein